MFDVLAAQYRSLVTLRFRGIGAPCLSRTHEATEPVISAYRRAAALPLSGGAAISRHREQKEVAQAYLAPPGHFLLYRDRLTVRLAPGSLSSPTMRSRRPMPLVPVPPVRYRCAVWRVHGPFLLGA